MRQYHKQLFNVANGQVGNHRKETRGNLEVYIYHWTEVFIADNSNKTFKVNNGGWSTSSTTQAINGYREIYTAMGYKEEE